MEPCGEVGLLMNLGGENTGSEILKSLLTSSKMQKTEPVKVSILSNLEPQTQPDDQIVFQIELDPIKSEFVPRNENIIEHFPVTYLTPDNPNLTHGSNKALVEPMTYVLSQDVLHESVRYCSVGGAETQKIILLQEVDSQSSNSDMKSFAVKENQMENANNRMLKEEKKIKIENNNSFEKRKTGEKEEEHDGAKVKIEKKISIIKSSLDKRKNSKLKTKLKTVGKALIKKAKKPLKLLENQKPEGEEKERRNLFELTKLEDNVDQVAERLKIGCECSESNCFDGLKPDDVFKHRLNIADLTKAEHDMYLMGVIMASIHNLEETCRHKERVRIRSCYAYQGKKVCLTAFLYLQHVTLYQMKRLRSHLKNHGVSPRIHGNRGRKPANTFSLDIYRKAANFVQKYVEEHCVKTIPNFTRSVESKNKITSYHLPQECSKRTVHREYKTFCETLRPSQKVMKYSTFTNFLKKQFPNVKFQKKEEAKQERIMVKLEERDEWKFDERKQPEDQGVDKCIQVDKTLVYLPTNSQILINGERLKMYDESGASNQVALDGQNSEQFV